MLKAAVVLGTKWIFILLSKPLGKDEMLEKTKVQVGGTNAAMQTFAGIIKKNCDYF